MLIPALTDLDGSLVEELLNTIDAPVVLLSPEGDIVRFNRACEKITGYSVDEAMGRKVWDFLILHEEIEAVKSAFERAWSNTPTHFTNYWKTKNGERRLIEWSNKGVRNNEGRLAYIVATGRDITDRQARETALIESQAFLRSIIDASPVAVITINDKGEILTFSRRAEITFGYKESEVLGKNVKVLMPEPDKSQHDAYIGHYLGTGEKRIIGKARPVTALRQNGEEFPAVLHVSEFLDGDHIFVGFVEDVSEKRKTERQLSETQDQLQHAGRLGAMGEIATSIAHELNQPLTAAASLAGAASLTLKKADQQKNQAIVDLLEDAIREIRRASEIIRNMRDFVRKRKTARSLHDVNKVVEDASKIALIGADADGVKVTMDFGEGVGRVMLDRVQIQQVVTNLVRNAIDAMKEAPERKLSVSTAKRDGMIEVRIEDTGPGISEEIRNQLFQPFVTSKDDGTGIGLSISKAIIDAHQGEIFASNKEPPGCVFTFRLPVGN